MESNARIETVETGIFASVVADEIAASIIEAIDDHGCCSMVLSGGSTPSSVYRLLSRVPYTQDIPWDNVHLFIGDDKWATTEDVRSNSLMISETLLSHHKSPTQNIHFINTGLANSEEAARAYTKDIKTFFNIKNDEVPSFDVVLLGVGADGHIASAFPDSTVLHDHQSIACAVEHEGIKGITLTPHVLFNGKRILILVKGKDKAEIVNEILRGRHSAMEMPAMLYQEAAERVTWFLSSDAAQLLNGLL